MTWPAVASAPAVVAANTMVDLLDMGVFGDALPSTSAEILLPLPLSMIRWIDVLARWPISTAPVATYPVPAPPLPVVEEKSSTIKQHQRQLLWTRFCWHWWKTTTVPTFIWFPVTVIFYIDNSVCHLFEIRRWSGDTSNYWPHLHLAILLRDVPWWRAAILHRFYNAVHEANFPSR